MEASGLGIPCGMGLGLMLTDSRNSEMQEFCEGQSVTVNVGDNRDRMGFACRQSWPLSLLTF